MSGQSVNAAAEEIRGSMADVIERQGWDGPAKLGDRQGRNLSWLTLRFLELAYIEISFQRCATPL